MKTKEVKYQEARERNWRGSRVARFDQSGKPIQVQNVILYLASETKGEAVKSNNHARRSQILSVVKHKLGVRQSDETYDTKILGMIPNHSIGEG